MLKEDYSYHLPKELIANAPAEPRDAARLFVYSATTDEVVLDTFANLARYLPSGSLLVLNDTKVVPARLELKKLTGGLVRVLFLFNEWDRGMVIKGLPDKGLDIGEALYANARPIVEIVSHAAEEFTFKLLVPPGEFEKLCDSHGRTPLPPYIHSDLDEKDIRAKYQSTFAANPASVAAPTASLHFTDRVFRSLDDKDIRRAVVTLHVGRGTFSPVSESMKSSGTLHAEPIHINREASEAISTAKKSGQKIVSAGTTATRLLEAAANDILAGRPHDGETDLFIRPPYDFRVVDAMITNFHLPGTSLIMLLDAFLQGKHAKKPWRDLYDRAIAERFRFYSFGDAMLIV
jgi:S-adenosylmethionine:tRNA ribosyltransferase-isomerase